MGNHMSNLNESLTFTDLKCYRDNLFNTQHTMVKHPDGHKADSASYVIDRTLPDYLKSLPTIPAQYLGEDKHDSDELLLQTEYTFMEYVEKRIETALREGKKPALTVLDVGTGQGRFLITLWESLCQKYFQGSESLARENLHFTGISYDDLREARSVSDTPGDDLEVNRTKQSSYGIKYIVGDAKFLNEILNSEKEQPFDLIVSNVALCYIHPTRIRLEVVKDIYRNLAKDGIAVLHAASLTVGDISSPERHAFNFLSNHLIKDDERLINEYLFSRGLDIFLTRDGDIVMHKTSAYFSFPHIYKQDGTIADPVERRLGISLQQLTLVEARALAGLSEKVVYDIYSRYDAIKILNSVYSEAADFVVDEEFAFEEKYIGLLAKEVALRAENLGLVRPLDLGKLEKYIRSKYYAKHNVPIPCLEDLQVKMKNLAKFRWSF